MHYLKFGQGSRAMVTLHGFGDRAALFLPLAESLGATYTVYALDLPYHGATVWPDERFTLTDLEAVVEQLAAQESFSCLSLLGYSFGGRLALHLVTRLSNRLDRLVLVAPDGLETKWMFNPVLLPVWFRKRLYKLLQRPETMQKLLERLHRLGLLSRFSRDFALNHIKTAERRDRIFRTWWSLDFFALPPETLKSAIARAGIRVDMIYGTRDEVIPVSGGWRLKEGLNHVNIHLEEEGHLLIQPSLNQLLQAILKT